VRVRFASIGERLYVRLPAASQAASAVWNQPNVTLAPTRGAVATHAPLEGRARFLPQSEERQVQAEFASLGMLERLRTLVSRPTSQDHLYVEIALGDQ
jgi:hypothetical protein